jgi:hypothetical protein
MTPWDRVRAELGVPHCELEYSEVERWRGAIVYVWTRGDAVLYVGASSKGLERPLAVRHERLRDFAAGDRLTVWRTADPFGLEEALIRQLRPALNNGGDRPKCQDCGRPAIGRLRLRDGRCETCEFLARPPLEAQARALDKLERSA